MDSTPNCKVNFLTVFLFSKVHMLQRLMLNDNMQKKLNKQAQITIYKGEEKVE
jgi:hypothetical protein